ncbi:unnamed protein product [Coffea canephora]|uniref:Disease resistance R13L4/SHOC-2-like LRR domain-containing protein n=1 Tax=Coffea canephora TaxID=49390 RepID=A0A068US81_COFCA|nr:unnamed protein product [Coffea canephora]
MENLEDLYHLDLGNNNLTIKMISTIPSFLGSFKSLRYLDLFGAGFQGMIPYQIGILSSLCTFSIEGYDLITLDTTCNHLNGPIPSTVGNCTKLKVLRLSHNILTTTKWLNNSTSLEVLELRGNALSGSIPSNLGKLSSWEYLDISENKLTGTLPKSLGQLSKLEKVFVWNGVFLREISTFSVNIIFNYFFILHTSNLSAMCKLDSACPIYDILDLGSWRLGPQFPTWLQSQKNLDVLNLFSTGILDTILPWLFSASINYVDLYHNQLHGKIQISLKLGLYLHCKFLSGEIPDYWMNYPSMKYFTLSSGNFTGSIPRSLVNLECLNHLDLGNNSLTGLIPSTL